MNKDILDLHHDVCPGSRQADVLMVWATIRACWRSARLRRAGTKLPRPATHVRPPDPQSVSADVQIWGRQNCDSSWAAILHNRGDKAASITLPFDLFGYDPAAPVNVKDLWTGMTFNHTGSSTSQVGGRRCAVGKGRQPVSRAAHCRAPGAHGLIVCPSPG